MAMASSSMYGNLRQFDGAYGNHLLAPTGVLQRLYEEADPRTTLGGAFGGGVVRLERRGTTGGVFDELFFNADVSHEQPPYAVTLLRDAVPGHPARYFEFYAARNYFERGNSDHADTALHNEKGAGLAPAAQSGAAGVGHARHELAAPLAKARGEPFKVAYAKLSGCDRAHIAARKRRATRRMAAFDDVLAGCTWADGAEGNVADRLLGSMWTGEGWFRLGREHGASFRRLDLDGCLDASAEHAVGSFARVDRYRLPDNAPGGGGLKAFTHEYAYVAVPPTPGDLWVFPGHVSHAVLPRALPGDASAAGLRISVACNAVLS
ncbi:hypothetical protein JL721_3785 [Aureococcus anophagefferens]|nr:hypothetical protein JL721_3785 [Aureococcus anophagefferens]